MHRFIITLIFILLSLAFPLFAQEEGEDVQNQNGQETEENQSSESPAYSSTVPSGVDGYVILGKTSTIGWKMLDAGGDGVYVKPAMSRIYFEVGREYYIDLSNLDSAQFPLDIKSGSGDILLTQREKVSGKELEGVNASISDDGVRFTLSQSLAGRISMLRAAPYPEMVIFVMPVSEDNAEDEEKEQADTGEQEE